MLINEENSDPLKLRDCRDTQRCSQQHRYPHPEYLPPPQNMAASGPRRTGGKHPAHVAGEGASLSSSSPPLLSFLSSLFFLPEHIHYLIAPAITHKCAAPKSLPGPDLLLSSRSICPFCPGRLCVQIHRQLKFCQTSLTFSPLSILTWSSCHIPDVNAGTFEVIHLFNTTLMLPASQALCQDLGMLR